MAFEGLKEKYKGWPMPRRMAASAVLGLLPGLYLLLDDSGAKAEMLVATQKTQEETRARFEADRQSKADLPKLEEKQAYVEEQMEKAKQSLPDTIRIEDILEKAATIARETGVQLRLFDPVPEVCRETAGEEAPLKFIEAPIRTRIYGRYNQIAAFMDRVVHLESSIFVKRIILSVSPIPVPAATAREMTPLQVAKAERENIRVLSDFELTVYRDVTPSDEQGLCQPQGGGDPTTLPPEGAPVESPEGTPPPPEGVPPPPEGVPTPA
jgi:Tfp pilus assembly protein PilO